MLWRVVRGVIFLLCGMWKYGRINNFCKLWKIIHLQVIFIHLLTLNYSQLKSVKNIKKYNFQNLLQTILKQAKTIFYIHNNFLLSVEVKVIKAHKITLTFFVFIYIAPIYIFWKSSPLPQSIVYFISTHTIKSHNKIIPKIPKIPQQHSPKITLIP